MPDILAPGGFELDRYEETRAKTVDDWKNEFGREADTSSDTPDGHIIDWATAMMQACLQRAGDAYQASFVTTAASVNQAAQILGPLFGSFPQQDTPTQGQVLTYGEVGTTIAVGAVVSSAQAGNRYQTVETSVITQTTFVALVLGPALELSTSFLDVGPQQYGPTIPVQGSGLLNAQSLFDIIPAADPQIRAKYGPFEDQSGNGVIVIDMWTPLLVTLSTSNSDSAVYQGSQTSVSAEESGAITQEAITVTRINSPVTGWRGVVNLQGFTTGTPADNLPRYLQRHLDTLGKNGTSTLVGLIGRLRDVNLNPGVEYVEIYNNPFSVPDSEGRDPKSFEVVKLGGSDETTALIIWENHPLGIESVGSTQVIITDPRTQGQHLIRFTNAAERFIWLDITITAGEGFPTLEISDMQAAVRNSTVAFGQTRGVGLDALSKDISTSWGLEGVESCVIEMGTTVSPGSPKPTLSTGNLAVSDTEILRWDVVRIEVTINV